MNTRVSILYEMSICDDSNNYTRLRFNTIKSLLKYIKTKPICDYLLVDMLVRSRETKYIITEYTIMEFFNNEVLYIAHLNKDLHWWLLKSRKKMLYHVSRILQKELSNGK